MEYRTVDDYYRREHLEFFARYRSPYYSLTFDLDAAALKRALEERGLPLYLNLSYLLLRAMQGIEDFRYRLLDGSVVLYERLHPGLVVPAPGGRFSFCALRYDPDLATFNREARAAMAAATRGVDLTGGTAPNYVYFTALPKVAFSHFTHVVPDDPTSGRSQVAFGKLRPEGDRLWVPIGLQVNHLFIDGNALGRLAEEAQALWDGVEALLGETAPP
jgi:chloramphenicol O-acetyltransferase type A